MLSLLQKYLSSLIINKYKELQDDMVVMNEPIGNLNNEIGTTRKSVWNSRTEKKDRQNSSFVKWAQQHIQNVWTKTHWACRYKIEIVQSFREKMKTNVPGIHRTWSSSPNYMQLVFWKHERKKEKKQKDIWKENNGIWKTVEKYLTHWIQISKLTEKPHKNRDVAYWW